LPKAKLSTQAKKAQILRDKAYVIFLIWQCEACLVALHRARGEAEAIRRHADVTRRPHFAVHQQAFADFQSALTFAGNISKLIWPVAKRLRRDEIKAALSRGRRIRLLLGIKQRDRVLFNSPAIRNNFEHLDNRVDVWAEGTTGGSIALHAVAGEKRLKGIPTKDRFTRYDPDADVFSMLGDKINLKRLEASVKRVWSASALVYRQILDYEALLESQAAPNPRR
jgi:hypothetical protein